MNKGELISAVANASDMSNKAATQAVNSLIETIGEALAKGDTVQLVGFGSFTVKKRPARTGRNPRTGDEIKIPAANVPGFKPGKQLKDSVNP